MARIAFLGLGAMGSRMAARLIAAGHVVIVWNRSRGPTQALRALGASVASTPRLAAEDADVVISMVFGDAASRAVWLDETGGALAGMPSHAIAIESITLVQAWIAELHAEFERRGIAFVDAPVAGLRPKAEAGQLIFMVGGAEAIRERVKWVLLAMGSAVHHVGLSGSGARLKLAVNALFGTQVVAMAEQLALLRGVGVDAERALPALKAIPVMSPAAANAAMLMLVGDFTPQAPVDLIAQDIGYVRASSAQTLPLMQEVATRLAAAQAAGLGGENIVAVGKLYR